MKRLTLLAVVLMAGCGWRGTPKTPVDGPYSACVKACPSHVCAPMDDHAKLWECLPDPTKPEAGK